MDMRSLCLGALMAGDASGYEIRKMFEEGEFSFFQMASLGSIYPALTKLSQDGLVTFTEQEQENRPDKKVYHLTPEGRRRFLRTLFQTQPGEDRYRSDILFMLSFADELPVELCEALIDEYATRQEVMLERILSSQKDADNTAGCVFLNGLGDAICRTTLDFIVKNKQPFLADIRKRRSRAS
jgi:DNA-binding PadR family transcriptional regulator